ncbi:YVTN family beta-propeller repeat protein [Cumulibacter manganitolerans]|uniref:YVTN family beta-propeller repeat protein n=1 Tax=Cumulibacter manganitolerans TaxID=1884992 RepID=UPI001294F3AA|nr:YncE family protein [Cumulibacter manganitolerans]
MSLTGPTPRRPRSLAVAAAGVLMLLTACSGSGTQQAAGETGAKSSSSSPSATSASSTAAASADLLPGMPPPLSPTDVYAADKPNNLSDEVKNDAPRVYVPNSKDDTVSVIDQATMQVIATYPTGHEPQHVVPSYDLKTLYVIADLNFGAFTLIDPKTGNAGATTPIDDPYNLYFTPDGKYGIVVAEDHKRLDWYDPHSWQKQDSTEVPDCAGVDHIDFTANGKVLLATCEFANRVAVVDVQTHKLINLITLPNRPDGMPQDVKLSPDGKTFYVADMKADGVYTIDGEGKAVTGFIPTGKGTHGLYVDRTSTRLFVTNRLEGSISVIDLATKKVATKWQIPGGGSPDMGNLSADGKLFWVSGRYDSCVYVISTDDGHLVKKIPVGKGPHGLTVWPQPGRYSLGHTGIMR